jgi:hemerythrin superfamily protein
MERVARLRGRLDEEDKEIVMDAIGLLKADHQEVERLCRAFEKAGPRARAAKAALVGKILDTLAVHAVLEEQVLYPVVRAEMTEASDYVLDCLEEHHVVAGMRKEIAALSPDHERFDPKVRVLMEIVRYHIGEEDDELFPAVRAALSRQRLSELGTQIEELRRVLPARPAPHLPDFLPADGIVGVVAGAVDRARHAGKKAIQEARHLAS